MRAEAWRLAIWGTLAGAAVLGCRENVYIGDPVYVADQVVPDASPPVDSDVPDEAQPPEAAPVDRPRPVVAWYLHAVGSKIFDANDVEFRLKGINWSGLETNLRVPDGLHLRTLDEMMARIAKLGFNLIRIPYATDSVTPTSVPLAGFNITNHNPDLAGLSSLEVLDRIIDVAADYGLRVILDRYRFRSDSGGLPPSRWYSGTDPASMVGGAPESTWLADWERLAARYLSRPNMVGCDLHDETGGQLTWGDDNPNLDWRVAAERAGNRILAVNPNLVIVVGGIEGANPTKYWPGGNLRSAGALPVRLSARQLIYSIHDYGMSLGPDKPWFADPNFNFEQLWTDNWGYLMMSDTAPVIVGAFTDRMDEPDIDPEWSARDAVWRMRLTSYMAANQVGYIFWAINPSSEGRAGLLDSKWDKPDPAWATLLQLDTTAP